ncbi:unnamed protein product, partial [Ectocarpus fasciculatus]
MLPVNHRKCGKYVDVDVVWRASLCHRLLSLSVRQGRYRDIAVWFSVNQSCSRLVPGIHFQFQSRYPRILPVFFFIPESCLCGNRSTCRVVSYKEEKISISEAIVHKSNQSPFSTCLLCSPRALRRHGHYPLHCPLPNTPWWRRRGPSSSPLCSSLITPKNKLSHHSPSSSSQHECL